jgi:hypothetical protein
MDSVQLEAAPRRIFNPIAAYQSLKIALMAAMTK